MLLSGVLVDGGSDKSSKKNKHINNVFFLCFFSGTFEETRFKRIVHMNHEPQ